VLEKIGRPVQTVIITRTLSKCGSGRILALFVFEMCVNIVRCVLVGVCVCVCVCVYVCVCVGQARQNSVSP
jgi:hypothetical protein